MGCCGGARLVLRVVLLALLLALVPAGYLTYEYFLKDWGRDRLRDYAQSVATAAGNAASAANGATLPELSGALVDGVACVHCVGVNNVFPITATSHPTYGGFQKLLINDGGWITSALLTAGVAVGGGGSLVVSLLHTVAGTSASAASSVKPTSSTAQNGCGIFEMVFLVSQAQFLTMLGALQLQGAPRFFLELARKLAWSNLQIFPAETSYRPPLLEVTSAVAGASRRLDTTADANAATGVDRYARLVGAEPRHFFYYTCAALAVALAGVLVAYALLRVLLGGCLGKRAAAASLDHRVIWVFLLVLLLAQYIISMASCFQIYSTVSDAARNTSDLLLAVFVLAAACVALLAFGIIKIARHRDEIEAHGTPAHDATKWFHLRYSVFYQDYTVENAYFFVAKMVLDVASGAVVGTVQDAPLQIALLVAFNAAFLGALIWRQPFLVPLFYFVAVFAGYLRIALLLLTLVLTKPDVFPQDVRDYVGALIIAINGVLFLCLLVRQFYVLCVAIFRWASRSKQPVGDEEMGIPLQDMRGAHNGGQDDEPRKSRASTDHAAPGAFSASRASTKASSGKSSHRAAPETPPISDSTLFSSQPYHAMTGDEPRSSRSTKPSSKRRSKADRHSLPGYSSAVSTDEGSTASAPARGGGRRSLYTRRAKRHRELVGTKNEDLPDWAKV